MRTALAALAAASMLAALVACAPPPGGGSAAGSRPAGLSQSAGENACRAALVDFHGVKDVRIASPEPYQGGGRYVLGSVIANFETGKRELWPCVAYADGSTGEIQYLSDDPGSPGGGGSPAGAPTPAEQAGLRDVTRTTNNPDVVVLESSFSQAGTEVIVGVGPQRAPWRCIAYSDGTSAGIMSLSNGGAL